MSDSQMTDSNNETQGLVLVSAMPLRNADAKRPGMHSNAKRWNEAVKAWPK